MHTITKISASHGNRYFTADTPGGQIADSQWQGNGATALGLIGPVQPDDLDKVLNGWTPGEEREPMFQNRKANRVSAIDSTFKAPKSVSVMGLVDGETAVIDAHRLAVEAALRAIEADVQARIRENKKSIFVETKSLIVAKFEHILSRSNDPHLHTHGLIINATKASDRWRSLYLRRLFQKIKEYGKVYRDHLASALRSLGHKLRDTRNGLWEIANVSSRVIDIFSKRHRQIDESVEKSASMRQREISSLETRPQKNEPNMTALNARWQKEATKVIESYEDRDRL